MVRSPRVTITSFTAIGTPASAPGSLPAASLIVYRARGGQSPFRRKREIGVGLGILRFGESQRRPRQFFGAKIFREQAGANGIDGVMGKGPTICDYFETD